MNKFLAVITSVAAVSFVTCSPVLAQSFTPANATITATGQLQLKQTLPIPVTCTANFNLKTTSGVGKIDTGSTFSGGWPCGSPVTPINLAWSNITVLSWTTGVTAVVRIPVDVQAVGGTCTGTIQGTLNVPAKTITFPTGTSVVGSSPGCTVAGVLNLSTTVDVI